MDTLSTSLPHVRRLHSFIGRVSAATTLQETLEAVAAGVVEMAGFRVAAINYLRPDGRFEVVAVEGDDGAAKLLLGTRRPGDAFDAELAVADRWGGLYFIPHGRKRPAMTPLWVADIQASDVPGAWHPEDTLYAPLRSASKQLVGMLAVDLPVDMRLPGKHQRELLEMFAAHAGIAIDNTRLTERLLASEKIFRLAFDAAGAGMALVDMSSGSTGRYLEVNQALCDLLGRPAADLRDRCLDDVTHPADRTPPDGLPTSGVPTSGQTVHRLEKRYLAAHGDYVWVAETLSVVGGDDGTPLYGVTQVEDISALRAARDALAHEVDHDPLTGLPNRRTLNLRLAEAVAATARSGRSGAVLFCDLDHFKRVNDRFGHAGGDAVLVAVAQRLATGVRQGDDVVIRLAGDEFIVVAVDLDVQAAQLMADRLRALVAAPIPIDSTEVLATISIGVAAITPARQDPRLLLRLADDAMYRAKVSGRDRYDTAP